MSMTQRTRDGSWAAPAFAATTPEEERGSERPFSALFGGRYGDGSMATLARSVVRAGYAVLPITPGGTTPLCPLTKTMRDRADRAAAYATRAANQRRYAGERSRGASAFLGWPDAIWSMTMTREDGIRTSFL